MPTSPPQTDPGPFLSALDWVGDVGQIPLQVLRGRPGAAGRRFADVLGDIPDALLPGDWIPSFSEEDPDVRASELLGIDPTTSPGFAKAADIGLGTALNPLTYMGLRGGAVKAGLPLTEGTAIPGSQRLLERGKELLGTGYGYLPEGIRNTASNTAAKVRRTLNWLDVPDEGLANVNEARGLGVQAAQVGGERVRQIYSGLTPAESEAVGEIAHGIQRAGTDRAKWQVLDDADAYLAGRTDIRPDVVRKAVAERQALMGTLWDEGLDAGGFQRMYELPSGERMVASDLRRQLQKDIAEGAVPPDTTLGSYATSRGFTERGTGAAGSYLDTHKLGVQAQLKQEIEAGKFPPGTTLEEYAKARGLDKAPSLEYLQRQFSGDYFKDLQAPEFVTRGSASPKATKAREEALRSREGLLKFLQDNPSAELDFNAMNVDARRAAQQGQIIQKAALGRKLTGKADFALTNEADRAAVDAAIKNIAKDQPDYAYLLENAFRGTPPRADNWFAKGLHLANKAFKPAATFGIVLPRIGFNVRNRISNMWQVLSDEQARGTLGANSKRVLSDLYGAFDDGFIKMTGGNKPRWAGDDLTKALDHVEQSLKAAGGSTTKFRELLAQHPQGKLLQEALDNGVMDNFVSSEELLSRMAKTPRAQRVDDILNWPAAVAQGLEQRMRLGTFMDLRLGANPVAKSAQEAAQTVRNTALDYSVPGVENRAFRDIVPFGAFLSQNIKQQAGFLARHPVAAVAAEPFFGDDEGLPKYPWLEQQMSYPVGLDEQGNPQYMSGFGLPIEGMTAIPGLGGEGLYRDLVSPLQPLLKTGVAYATGKDPFTGREFGEYDKLFGEPMGAFGRAVNIAKGSGLFQPISGPLDQAANLLDERKSIGERAAQNLTGARFTSVDPDLAKRQRIEAYLEQNPDAKQYRGFYAEEENPELSELLKELNDAKQRLKAKRDAAGVL